jgi:GntR family transcriptional repressor for pyruvate dehydrogenase complex
VKTFKKEPITQQVVTYLTGYIADKDLKVGDSLPTEIELTKKLQIGRSTVREAVGVMQANGLIERRHGVGIVVSDKTGNATINLLALFLKRENIPNHEVLEIRKLLEISAVKSATHNHTEEDINDIKEHLDILNKSDVKLDDYINADVNFHLTIAKASHNSLIFIILSALRPVIFQFISKTVGTEISLPEKKFKIHHQIFDCICKRDEAGAVKMMASHLKLTRDMLGF